MSSDRSDHGTPKIDKSRPAMVPAGTVEPPKQAGKSKREARLEAERFIKQLLARGEPYLLAGFVTKPDGGLQLVYRCNEFPHSEFVEAAELFAQLLTRLLGGAAVKPQAPESEASDPNDNEVDALPASL